MEISSKTYNKTLCIKHLILDEGDGRTHLFRIIKLLFIGNGRKDMGKIEQHLAKQYKAPPINDLFRAKSFIEKLRQLSEGDISKLW